MDGVNKTLYIPLYGKSFVSRKGIILHDPKAEDIWEKEGFELKGKSRSKWLSYNMAMRARVFDDWTRSMIRKDPDSIVLHIGCGLDSRCVRVEERCAGWYDCDFPDVLKIRSQYYQESDNYHMIPLDSSDIEQIRALPDSTGAIVVLEGISMYLTSDELKGSLAALHEKYETLHILMDVYTVFGARASKYKNPINDVGVTTVYGIDDIEGLVKDTGISVKAEHSITPGNLIDELEPSERRFFRTMFTGKSYRRIYRLYELVCE